MTEATTAQVLADVVHRVEAKLAEREQIAEDIKEILKDGKRKGLDPTRIREVVKIRGLSEKDRAELTIGQTTLTYLQAVETIEKAAPKTTVPQTQTVEHSEHEPAGQHA